MSFYDFFRRAFGINSPYDRPPGQPGFRNPIWEEESDDDDDELDDDFRYAPIAPFGFHIFSGNVIDMHKYFEQQMDEMLKNFQSSFFGSDLLQLPESDLQMPSKETEAGGANKYLKPWYDQSPNKNEFIKQDTDIDGRFKAGDLRQLFPSEEEEGTTSSAHVPSKVFGQSIITRIVRTADGRLEEEKRVRGSDGREEVSLTRQIGDQTYKVIKKKDQHTGVLDTTEELINLDEDKLDEFNKKWAQTESISRKPAANKDKMVTIYPSDNETSLTRLFEKWFK